MNYPEELRERYNEVMYDERDIIEKNMKFDIMDTYNAHNAELVRKINAAWKSDEYHDYEE